MTFDEMKDRMDDEDPDARERAINDFVRHYLSSPALREIASRQLFDQLRPLHTVNDLVQMAMMKVEKRLRSGKLQLRTENEFFAYVTRTMQLIVPTSTAGSAATPSTSTVPLRPRARARALRPSSGSGRRSSCSSSGCGSSSPTRSSASSISVFFRACRTRRSPAECCLRRLIRRRRGNVRTARIRSGCG